MDEYHCASVKDSNAELQEEHVKMVGYREE